MTQLSLPSVPSLAGSRLSYLLLPLLALLSILAALGFGAADISLGQISHVLLVQFGLLEADTDLLQSQILLQLRLPRVLLAFITGAGLALSGSVLQTVTRNPLADPYLFGISSGASAGAVLVMAHTGMLLGALTLPLGAFAGGLLAVLLVLSLAGRSQSIERLVLAGVAVSFMLSALTSLLIYLGDQHSTQAVLFWMMGSFAGAQWSELALPALLLLLTGAVLLGYHRQLDAMLLGEESARTLGVDTQRLRLLMMVLTSLLTAILVAYTGGIGFVGLMVPHLVRLFVGAGSLNVMLAATLAGGTFMIWTDVLARSLLSSQELPVGILTAAVGSGFFIVLLRKRS